MDFIATFAKIAGYAIKERKCVLDGIDMSNLFFGRPTVQRAVVWMYRTRTAIRMGKWKLINERNLFNLDDDISESKDLSDLYAELVSKLRLIQRMQMSGNRSEPVAPVVSRNTNLP